MIKKEIPEIILNILSKRGIDTENDLEEYFNDKPKKVHDAYLLDGMEDAIIKIKEALAKNKKIIIYGDYDADGTTATTLLLKVFNKLTDSIDYYIPSRVDEGYGLNHDAIDKIKKDGGELIITVDCGSSSVDEVKYAHSIGIDTIITDHHNIGDTPAEGIVINPKKKGDNYPFKGLAGVGVAYKLASAMAKEGMVSIDLMIQLTELVAIGTVADMMPLVDENRTRVKQGLKVISSNHSNKGIAKLVELSGVDRSGFSAQNIGFIIAPRINAAGRLGDASTVVELLMSEDEKEIDIYANRLIEMNNKRKAIQDEFTLICEEKAENELRENDFIIIKEDDIHEGVVGLVAGKIKEKYKRPVLLATLNGNEYKGSGRSIDKVDLFEMLTKHKDLFTKFGGHKKACGFTIKKENLDCLKKELNADINKMKNEDARLFEPDIKSDANIENRYITTKLTEYIEMMEPTGMSNEKPVFLIENSRIENFKFLKNGTKMALFTANDGTGDGIRCITFQNAEEYKEIASNGMVDIKIKIYLNNYYGKKNIQGEVLELKSAKR